jgi:hypothetical protein
MKTRALSEPVIVASWWKNRGGEAVRVRLLTFEGRNIVDIRTWWTGKDGTFQPGKGFACTVKHIPRLASALASAARKAEGLGLLTPGRGRAAERGRFCPPGWGASLPGA